MRPGTSGYVFVLVSSVRGEKQQSGRVAMRPSGNWMTRRAFLAEVAARGGGLGFYFTTRAHVCFWRNKYLVSHLTDRRRKSNPVTFMLGEKECANPKQRPQLSLSLISKLHDILDGGSQPSYRWPASSFPDIRFAPPTRFVFISEVLHVDPSLRFDQVGMFFLFCFF